jgi:hypothetical protein
MTTEKLFDYNSSFGVLRTNPKLTGNLKLTLDSTGGIWLNSMDVNPTLSLQKYKKFSVTGQNTYAKDVHNFFDEGNTSNDIVFQVGNFTNGARQTADTFSSQYDFFYASGASTLVDKNYPENFRYFQPLWIRDVIPDYFVIFKVPNPISYPYPSNVETIVNGSQYKIIASPDSTEPFIIQYWNNETSSFQNYTDGEFFNGNSIYSTYTIVQGSGSVTLMDELKNYADVNNAEQFFNSKILPNAQAIATFDLRSKTNIGRYIRSIVDNPGFNQNPFDFSLQANTYSYYNGISIKNGVYTQKGEFLNPYLTSTDSSSQIDFEEYITDGFSRNGIICPNLLNMEFLFDDPDADLYSINRYFGFYVSRNDVGEFKLNGQYFFDNKNDSDNLNLPKPSRNNIGYYYSSTPAFQSSTGGVRLYYQGASGWIPGSEDVNIYDPQKLYYVTDKFDRFYSLSRYENYEKNGSPLSYNPYTNTYSLSDWLNNTPDYLKFGPYYQDVQKITKAYSLLVSGSQYGYVNIVTETDHGLSDNDIISISGASQQIEGSWRITIPPGATGNLFQIPTVLSAGPGVVTGSTGFIPGQTSNYIFIGGSTGYTLSGSYYFGTTGSSSTKTGSLVISDTRVNLLDFTGPDEKIGSYIGRVDGQKGKAYTNVTFQKNLDLTLPVTFKIFWPNGSRGELGSKYDLITSGDYAGTLLSWSSGSHYAAGNNYYFNWYQGKTSEVAKAFSGSFSDISTVVWDAGTSDADSIIRVKNPGSKQNLEYQITVFSDYDTFESNYQGVWNNTSAYSVGNIVIYNNTYYESISAVPQNSFNYNPSPDQSSDWTLYYPFAYPGYVSIAGVDASQISYIQEFKGGTDYSENRVVFSNLESGNVIPGNWIEVQSGKGITGGLSMISTVTRYVDSPIYDNDVTSTTGTVTGFAGYKEYLVATLSDNRAVINLGSDSSFNVYSMANLYTGVFSFFDMKEIDFDFWSSTYGITPTSEFHRYFQLIPNQDNQLKVGVKYYVRRGSIRVEAGTVNQRVVNQGSVFICLSSTSFQDLNLNNQPAIVLPAVFTRMGYVDSVSYGETSPYNYGTAVASEQDLNSFNGFYGIQSLNPEGNFDENVKETLFEYGKLSTEYQYLEENYTVTRANKSRIVPYINKWVYNGGTDSRGNAYRLNVSPAFTPTNFSPGFQQDFPSPQYFTHEWMLLEGVPREFPINGIISQNNYLPYKIDLERAKNANPSNANYFNSYFTVDPIDYPSPYNTNVNEVKEFFTPFKYNSVTGFYDTIFRGIKISLKRRSTLPDPKNDLEKFVPNFRGFQDYKFSSILRVIPEDSSIIQSPVRYEVIENVTQKSILFVTYAVIKDYRALPIGYTGGTGGDPYLDYLLMYSLSGKKKKTDVGITGNPGPTGSPLYAIDDIKLSAALDLSFSSDSNCGESVNGQIYIIPNPEYDTDLREEINLYYPAGSTGIPGFGATGTTGTFKVLAGSSSHSYYPWPTGRSQNVVNFGPTNPANYYFDIPFSPTYPGPTLNIPLASQGAYKGKPVVQIEGGENYFDFILKRLSLSYIANQVNTESSYITYTTYDWNKTTQETVSISDYFDLSFDQPTAIKKPTGTIPVKSYSGPQTLGRNQPTGYEIVNGGISLSADILRYSGGYEPAFKKSIMYKNDKIDTITGATGIDLSYRNCTFAPEKIGFGLIDNLSYTKVSLGKNILSESQNLAQGSVYPLIGETPIEKKNFPIFSSTWDPGYYNLYTSSVGQTPVAGTRSMLEYKTFMGSKMMQTPGTISTYTFIALEISKTEGTADPQVINLEAQAATSAIQSMTPSQSNTGIGQLGPALSGVDLSKLDESIYPDIEVFWQKDPVANRVYGVIRLDRILRRYILNSGISSVFIKNIITEYGVGNPNNIQDDIKTYIDQNIVPIYEGKQLNLSVLKRGQPLTSTQILVRGDLINPDKIKYGYVSQPNFKLTQRTSLTYEFEYSLEVNQNYSLTFNFETGKI